MTELAFMVTGSRVEPYAAVPTLALELGIVETTGARVDSVMLHCQIRIEPERRRYEDAEAERLGELFGTTDRWGDTLQPFLWTHVTTTVPRFEGASFTTLHVPCSYDLEVAATKYLHALGDGDIPLLLLFSGSVFSRAPGAPGGPGATGGPGASGGPGGPGPGGPGGISVEQISWDSEARHRLPVRTWRELMDTYYPGSAWLRLDRQTIDALGVYKARHAIPTWDATLAALLADAEAGRSQAGMEASP